MTRRGFLGALLGLPAARALAPFAKILPLTAARVTNVRREVYIGARAAELKFGEPLAELAPAFGAEDLHEGA